jgi:hypothetical protein
MAKRFSLLAVLAVAIGSLAWVSQDQDLVLRAKLILVGPTATHIVQVPSNEADALNIKDAAGNSYFKVISTTGSKSVTLGQGFTISGNTAVTGNETISGTLGVTGATTLSSTLAAGNTTVTGNETISGTLGVTGASTLGTVASGNTVITGTLGVSGATALSSTLAAGNTTVTGTLSTTGNATVGGYPIYSDAATGITAHSGGGGVGSCFALTHAVNAVANVAADNDSVCLPALAVGQTVLVGNMQSVKILAVYGQTGVAINSGATDALYAVAAGKAVRCTAASTTLVICAGS